MDVTLAMPVCIRATSLGLRPTGPLPKNRTLSFQMTDCLPPLVPVKPNVLAERFELCRACRLYSGKTPVNWRRSQSGDRDRLDEYFEGLRGVERQLEYLDQAELATTNLPFDRPEVHPRIP